MSKKITKEEKEYLERELLNLEGQVIQSTEMIREHGFRPSFCSCDGGFDELPNYALYENNARLRSQVCELKNTLNNVEVEEVSTDKISLGTKFVVTANTLTGDMVTKKYILLGGLFMDINTDIEYMFVSVNSPFGKAVLNKKVNDSFSYVTPGNVVISGVVDEIILEKSLEDRPKMLIKSDEKNTSK